MVANDATAKQSIKLLLVDDDPSQIEISQEILALDSPFEIDVALSVDQALKKLQNNTYDAIISDYEMPQKTGLDFLKTLKKQKNQTPFILFTGKGREEIAIQALNLGAEGYFNKQGSPETVYGELTHGIQNVVLRKWAEAKLLENEHLTQKILNSTPNLIYIYDLTDNRNVYSNKEVTEFLGYSAEQITAMGSKLFANILHPDDAKAVAEHHARFLDAQDNTVYEIDYRMRHANGQWRWLHSHDMLFQRTPEGKVKQILGTCEDVTEQKRIQDEKIILSDLFNLATDAICVHDLDGNFLFFNNATCKLFGYNNKELYSINMQTLNSPSNRRTLETGLRILLKKGEGTFESVSIKKDGSEFPVEVHSRIITLNNKQLILSIIRDITERIKDQQILKNKERELNSIVDASPVMIFYKDLNGHFIQVNTAFTEALKTTKENLLGKTVFDIYSHDIAKAMTDDDHAVLESKLPKMNIVEPYESPNGLRWVRTHKVPNLNEKREVIGLIGFSEEITDYKKAEETLEFTNDRLHLALEASRSGIWEWDIETGDNIWSDEIWMLYGLDPHSVRPSYLTWRSIVDPLYLAKAEQAVKEAVGKGEEIRFDFRVNNNGPWLMSRGKPFFDDKGKVIRYVGVVIDVSDRKNAEEKLAADHLKLQVVTEKLQVIGSLTRHDVANKLMAAKTNLYLLKKRNANNSEILKIVEAIEGTLRESEKIFEFSSAYEKIGAEKLSVVKVADFFDDAAKLIPHAGVGIVNKAVGLEVIADSMLWQLFYNLIENSLKHGKTVTRIQLSYLQTDLDTRLVYEDNGVGIPKENKQKIFAEGFTTGGSGLGLKLVKKMIEVYGWSIEENGLQGKGARFTISIHYN
jgi:PAS domain S-box-containing protein